MWLGVTIVSLAIAGVVLGLPTGPPPDAWLLESGRMGGKNPSGVAAACIHRAAYDHRVDVSRTEVADLANVSRMTIRSTAKEPKNYG